MDNDIINYNKRITATRYFKIDDAVQAPIKSKTVFIIANERITSTNKIGRYYTVFPFFKEFLKNRERYIHCHELIVNHVNNKVNAAGRLVFDFDLKYDETEYVIPKKFKDQIENIVVEVVERYFNNVDLQRLEFVWSTSQNPSKFSKHLTVKNMYFDNWISMSRTFYKLFCIVWDEYHKWIPSSKLIDMQIVRNKGSLRMVGSKKINGYPLIFDNTNHKLTDSLIRIYFKTQRENEQLVTIDNINNGVFDNVLYESNADDDQLDYDFDASNSIVINFARATKLSKTSNKSVSSAPSYEMAIYRKAFTMYNDIVPGIFKMGSINGSILSLLRLKPSKCIMSGKQHDSENAYLVITKTESEYSVKFGCYRNCSQLKVINCGIFTIDNHTVVLNPAFTTAVNPTKTSHSKTNRGKSGCSKSILRRAIKEGRKLSMEDGNWTLWC